MGLEATGDFSQAELRNLEDIAKVGGVGMLLGVFMEMGLPSKLGKETRLVAQKLLKTAVVNCPPEMLERLLGSRPKAKGKMPPLKPMELAYLQLLLRGPVQGMVDNPSELVTALALQLRKLVYITIENIRKGAEKSFLVGPGGNAGSKDILPLKTV